MNTLEKYRRIMNFDISCPTLKWEMGYWAGTVRRWYKEGLPCKVGIPDSAEFGDTIAGPAGYWLEPPKGLDVADAIEYDKDEVLIPVEIWMQPRFKSHVIEETGDYQIVMDRHGVISKITEEHASIPYFLSWPVSNRDDFERLKAERFVLSDDRFPKNWSQLLEDYKKRDYPLSVMGSPCGFFGSLRRLMGEERLFATYYDDPDFIREMLNFFTDFWIEMAGRILSQVKADSAQFWEDMCYKNGPLISPAMFREFMLPCYKKLTSFLKEQGVKNIIVDTDGDCWSLIPLFIEGGVTCLSPMEVQSGMDIVEVRKAFPKLQIIGGIDKKEIAAGPDAIDRELEKVKYMLKFGGYIPIMDHHVPPEVSWENFRYYRKELGEIIDSSGI